MARKRLNKSETCREALKALGKGRDASVEEVVQQITKDKGEKVAKQIAEGDVSNAKRSLYGAARDGKKAKGKRTSSGRKPRAKSPAAIFVKAAGSFSAAREQLDELEKAALAKL